MITRIVPPLGPSPPHLLPGLLLVVCPGLALLLAAVGVQQQPVGPPQLLHVVILPGVVLRGVWARDERQKKNLSHFR